MSDQTHQEWEELAAAHALDALEPEEEQRLAIHVATCELCRRTLDDYQLVAAQLGSLADDEDAPPSWQQIRSTVVPDDSAMTRPSERSGAGTSGDSAPVVPLSRPAVWRRPRVLAAAAAVVVLVAAGIVGWQLGTRSSPAPATAALTACQQQPGCKVVHLHSSADGDKAAVIVDSGRASVVPLGLAKPSDGSMYVLWQLPRDGGTMIPVAGFRQAKNETASSQLPRSYDDTAAFAISLERAGKLPARPSGIVAVGATA